MIIQIISGFLGAGKTTFINKYIEQNTGKTVIIENEFGEIGLDKKLIQSDIPIKEINSGCICCSLATNFLEGIKEIIEKYSPDKILIEPSGVAQLSDILKICNYLKKEYEIKEVDKVVIVDVYSFQDGLEYFGNFYINQIENANLILFSNIDKINEKTLEEVINRIKEINENCIIFTQDWRKLDNDMLESIIIESRKIKANVDNVENYVEKNNYEHNHIANNIFESISIKEIKEIDEKKLEKLKNIILKKEYGNIVRIKGIIPVKNEKKIYYHIEGNISTYSYKKINIKDFKNIEKNKKNGLLILIGSSLKKEYIKNLFIE